MKHLAGLFVVAFLALYGLLSYYIGLRGWQYIFKYLPGLNSVIYWVIFWLVAWAYVLEFWGRKIWPHEVSVLFTWLGSYWLGIMFYAFLILGLTEFIHLLAKWSGFLPKLQTLLSGSGMIISGAVLFLLMGILTFGTYNALNPKVTRYEVTVPKVGTNLTELKLVMVSDIHLGQIVGIRRLEKMVIMINQRKPDLVIFAGDMIDGNVDIFIKEKMDQILKKIESRHGVYGVLGNHEYIGGGVEKALRYLEKGGVNMLRDKVVEVAKGFYLIGRDERSAVRFTNTARKDLVDLLDGVDTKKPMVLIDHQPQDLTEAEELGIDLMLSGHTHRGQFFPVNLITRRIFENDWGYLVKGNLQVIVSNGFGTWGPPIRIGNRPELVEIMVNFQS